jgi:transposase-like protein
MTGSVTTARTRIGHLVGRSLNLCSRRDRKVVQTTNAVEGLNRMIRKAIRTRGSIPPEQAADPRSA